MVGVGVLRMPSSPHLVIRAGSRGRSAFVFARDEGAGAGGVTGLRHDAPGVASAYLRSGSGEVQPIALREGRADRHVPGGFREVDRRLLPGLYELGLPDTALAEGSPRVIVSLQARGAVIEPVVVSLVAYDPREPERMGMVCLEWPVRWRFLRRGLPKLTSIELALQAAGEEP
jgi:hypothetical protein